MFVIALAVTGCRVNMCMYIYICQRSAVHNLITFTLFFSCQLTNATEHAKRQSACVALVIIVSNLKQAQFCVITCGNLCCYHLDIDHLEFVNWILMTKLTTKSCWCPVNGYFVRANRCLNSIWKPCWLSVRLLRYLHKMDFAKIHFLSEWIFASGCKAIFSMKANRFCKVNVRHSFSPLIILQIIYIIRKNTTNSSGATRIFPFRVCSNSANIVKL